ncbi:MAG: twin-arginine translocation signal domain-containing protein [Deltaproteobacteria bacterium]|nr:twin-arginine translocation signal domain-containing protein [Deltaproteobacteria bacterium]
MSDKIMSDEVVEALKLDITLNRRQFLRGGAVAAGAGAVASIPLLPAEADAAQCVTVDGAIGGTRQRTIEAAGNVMLPKGGTHGASGSGVLDSVLYGKKIYAHLIDTYYANQVNQSDLDAAVTDLNNGALCMEFLQSYFYKLSCDNQRKLMAYGSKRSDEGSSGVSGTQALCLWFGSLFAPTLSNPAKAYDLARFMGLLFYSSPQGFSHMATFGYPGPNWGFDGLTCSWTALTEPSFGDLTAADLTCTGCDPATGPMPPSVDPRTL